MYSTHTSGQKVLDAEKADQPLLEEELHLNCMNSQKVLNAETVKQSSISSKRSQRINDTMTIPSIPPIEDANKKTRTSCIIKLSVKIKEVRESLSSF